MKIVGVPIWYAHYIFLERVLGWYYIIFDMLIKM